MLDMLGNEVKKNDVVAYVYSDKHGKTCSVKGQVKDFNKKGCVIETVNGKMNVRNVVMVKQNILNKMLAFLR